MSLHKEDWMKILAGAAILATGGAGLAGVGPLAGLFGAGAGGAGAAGGAGVGAAAGETAALTAGEGSAAASLAGTGAASGVGSGAATGGFGSLLGKAAVGAGTNSAAKSLEQPASSETTVFGQVPALQKQDDPWAWFQNMMAQGGKKGALM